MQVDSVYQQGLLLKAKQENIQLNHRINGLNNELNTTKSLLEVEEESNLILQMDINALAKNYRRRKIELKRLKMSLLCMLISINAPISRAFLKGTRTCYGDKIENQYFRTRQYCESSL